jgi:Mg2+-importing ATPase
MDDKTLAGIEQHYSDWSDKGFRVLGVAIRKLDGQANSYSSADEKGLTFIFGNMFSMAAASLFLPFLPLLAPQILLNNFLSDIPGTTIASDNVDSEWVAKPRRWNTVFIRDYLVLFGLVSSIFDFLTFGVLLFPFRASPEEFRTGWFIESLLTESVIARVVRTRGVFFRSRPGTLLLVSTLIVVGVTLMLPHVPFDFLFGFIRLPAPLMLTMLGLTALYILVTEIAKRYFYSRLENAIA